MLFLRLDGALYRNCKGDAPTTFMKCGIKNALGCKPTLPKKRTG